jgi:hypothetical protein
MSLPGGKGRSFEQGNPFETLIPFQALVAKEESGTVQMPVAARV